MRYFVGRMCYLGALKVARSWQGNRCATHHPTHHFGTRQMTMATQDIDLAMKKKRRQVPKTGGKDAAFGTGGLLRGKLIWPMMLCQGVQGLDFSVLGMLTESQTQ